MFSTQPIWSTFRYLLYPLALLYGLVIWLRNRLYDAGFFSSVSFNLPVICVGNLSVGGTGKTPHVEYLIRLLQYEYHVATMSRGYKRHTQGFLIADENSNALRIGDEPMQYHMKFPDVLVSVAEDRMTGIPQLLQKHHDLDVILLDDAFQHRSVKAGLNILITDYSKPYYKDHILPFGFLRENRGAAKRAGIIIVSKCPPGLTEAERNEIITRLAPQPEQSVFFTTIRYHQPYDLFTREPLMLEQTNALIVCGIARPETLVTAVEKEAAATHLLAYRDHHYFLSNDLEEIKDTYDNWEVENKIIVTTEKDAARLMLQAEKIREWNITIAVLPLQVQFLFNQGFAFDAAVQAYVEAELSDNDWMGRRRVIEG